jgi:signal recognition particle subunit SRP54
MTPKERTNPDIINQSRKLRIAKGSGTKLEEVNRLLKQFDQTKKMMKMVSGMDKAKMAQMAAAMKNMKRP